MRALSIFPNALMLLGLALIALAMAMAWTRSKRSS
jgi:hypothetical protein